MTHLHTQSKQKKNYIKVPWLSQKHLWWFLIKNVCDSSFLWHDPNYYKTFCFVDDKDRGASMVNYTKKKYSFDYISGIKDPQAILYNFFFVWKKIYTCSVVHTKRSLNGLLNFCYKTKSF